MFVSSLHSRPLSVFDSVRCSYMLTMHQIFTDTLQLHSQAFTSLYSLWYCNHPKTGWMAVKAGRTIIRLDIMQAQCACRALLISLVPRHGGCMGTRLSTLSMCSHVCMQASLRSAPGFEWYCFNSLVLKWQMPACQTAPTGWGLGMRFR